MKELSIEEKAKRYDEAIEKFEVILNLNTVKESGTIFADDVRKILPELKESEDEKTIKFIANELACIRATDEKGTCRYEELTKAIAWLEKQGEKEREIKFVTDDAYQRGYDEGVRITLKKQSEKKTADLENSLCNIQDSYSDTSYEYRVLGEAIEFIRTIETI